ncbi:MAG: TetR/AcrR family transcriptional regulator, partial [Bacteroidota bacterium]
RLRLQQSLTNMGIAERKAREKAQKRELILATARQLFLKHGFDAVSLRKIADELEYSPGTIYLYFKNKAELFFAIHQQGFDEFYLRMKSADTIEHPLERMRELGHIYLKFAIDNPEFYDLMFINRMPVSFEEGETGWESGMKTYSCLKETVAACIEAGHFSYQDVEQTAFYIWTHMHGMASLLIRDRLTMHGETNVDHLMEETMRRMLDMLVGEGERS